MIPKGGTILEQATEAVEQPSRTWKLDAERGRITGMIDGLDAVKQAVVCILHTERFRYLIYSSAYGFEGHGLVGQSRAVIQSEIKRRITEALTQDDRILDVTDFNIHFNGDAASVEFTVVSDYGSFRQEVALAHV